MQLNKIHGFEAIEKIDGIIKTNCVIIELKNFIFVNQNSKP